LSSWRWLFQSPNDKTDLLPVGAADYAVVHGNPPTTDNVLYFHGSLFAPNGSAAIGLWLFKDSINKCGTGVTASPFGINGVCDPTKPPKHRVGDVAVQADFIGSASVLDRVELRVFKWIGGLTNAQKTATCASPATIIGPIGSATLCQVSVSTNALCQSPGLANDDGCATLNLVATESPDDWGYVSKTPPPSGLASPPGTDGIGA